MDPNKFTEKVLEALTVAQSKAVRLHHQQVDVEHLLLALLEQERGLASSILNKAEVPVEALRERLEAELERRPRVTGGAAGDQTYITGRLNRLLTDAEEEARKLKDEYISVEHLLLVMSGDSGAAGNLLRSFGLSREKLLMVLQEPAAGHIAEPRSHLRGSGALRPRPDSTSRCGKAGSCNRPG